MTSRTYLLWRFLFITITLAASIQKAVPGSATLLFPASAPLVVRQGAAEPQGRGETMDAPGWAYLVVGVFFLWLSSRVWTRPRVHDFVWHWCVLVEGMEETSGCFYARVQ